MAGGGRVVVASAITPVVEAFHCKRHHGAEAAPSALGTVSSAGLNFSGESGHGVAARAGGTMPAAAWHPIIQRTDHPFTHRRARGRGAASCARSGRPGRLLREVFGPPVPCAMQAGVWIRGDRTGKRRIEPILKSRTWWKAAGFKALHRGAPLHVRCASKLAWGATDWISHAAPPPGRPALRPPGRRHRGECRWSAAVHAVAAGCPEPEALSCSCI